MRKLIKIFSVEETSLAEDLAELERRMKEVSQAKSDDEGVDSIEPINDYVPQVAGRDAADVGVHPGDDVNEVPSGPAANTRAKKRCAVCCCLSHCGFSLHVAARVKWEEMPLAMDLEGMNMSNIQALEEEDTESEAAGLMGLLNSCGADFFDVLGDMQAGGLA